MTFYLQHSVIGSGEVCDGQMDREIISIEISNEKYCILRFICWIFQYYRTDFSFTGRRVLDKLGTFF